LPPGLCGVYQPRHPRLTPFFQVVEDYWEEYVRVYDRVFEKDSGRWRPHVADVFKRFLACGDLREGFARVRCDDCGCEYLLAYSCKTTCFCPSCHQKRALLFAEWLDTDILQPITHRQYVIPKVLRGLFRREPALLGLLSRAAWRALKACFGAAFSAGETALAVPGAVLVVQTYGDRATNFHPHAHALVSEGVFAENGAFHPLPLGTDLDRLTDLFCHQVFRGLLQAQRINQRTIERMLAWQHYSGFNVHRGAERDAEDAEGRRRVARYLLHPRSRWSGWSTMPRAAWSSITPARGQWRPFLPSSGWPESRPIFPTGAPNWCGTWERTIL
jgi:hypothetical protein